MSKFHAYLNSNEQLFIADHDHEQQVEQQYAQAQSSLYSRDSEVQAMLDGLPHGEVPADTEPPPPPLPRPSMPPTPSGAASVAVDGTVSMVAGPVQRPNLENASMLSAAETRSVGSVSDSEGVVQIKRREDDQPLRRFVMRSSSFSKEDFERLLEHHGLFNAAAEAKPYKVGLVSDPRTTRTHLVPNKLEPSTGRHIGHADRCKSHSILQLPMIRPDNSWLLLWSTIVLLSDLMYSAFVVPISIGMWTSFYEANWTTICDFFFGAIFFSDIFISLHVGFIATYNTRKLLVMNGRLVARQYLTSFGFMVDFVSTIAWFAQIVMIVLYNSIDTFNPHTALIVMEGIRLLRFLRVVHLLSQLVSNGMYATLMLDSPYFKWLRNQTFLSAFYLLYLIAVVVNFLGCLWNFTAGPKNWENSWVNFYEPFIRRYGHTDAIQLTQDEAMEVNRSWLWLVGNYWALTTVATVGYGDVVASNATEVMIAMAVEIIGVMFFGLIISSISELLQQANRKARRVTMFQNKMQSVERFMGQLLLPSQLRRRIETFYAEVWIRQHEQKEETVLFQELPHALRNEVAWQACKRRFRRIPLLRELDENTLYLLSSKITPFRFAAGHDLVTEGDPADRFWLLTEGEVVALYHYREAERIEAPAVVGESVLLQEHEEALRTYPCTYRALTSCSCWMVRCRDFQPMLKPALQTLVKARVLQRLVDRIYKYPEVWEDKAFKRLRTGSPMRCVASANVLLSEPGGEGGSSSREDDASMVAGAAAIRSRLVRASAPVGAAGQHQHHRGISWGGEQLCPSPAAHLQPPHSGSHPLYWGEAATAAVAAVDGDGWGTRTPTPTPHPQQQQQQQSGPLPPTRLPLSRLSERLPAQTSVSVAPLIEGQPVHLSCGDAAAAAMHQMVSALDESPGAIAADGSLGAGAASVGASAPGTAAPSAAEKQQRQQQEQEQEEQHQRDPLQSVLVMVEHGVGAAGHGLAVGASTLATVAVAAARQGPFARLVYSGSSGINGEDGEDGEDAAELAGAPSGTVGDSKADVAMLRLPTDHAIAMLDRATQEREHEEEEAAMAAAAMAAVASAASAASVEPSSVALQVQMLARVLTEVQTLRRDVEAARRHSHTS